MARSFKVSSLVAALALAACGGPPPKHSPVVSTSNLFRLCELDTHCPGATYCSAGVCDFDCRQDSDCAADQQCDPRGRCLQPKAVPAPPKFAGKLVLSASELALTPANPQGSVQIQNAGGDPIDRFHVVSDDPLVSVTPASGGLDVNGSVTLQIAVDPGFQ